MLKKKLFDKIMFTENQCLIESEFIPSTILKAWNLNLHSPSPLPSPRISQRPDQENSSFNTYSIKFDENSMFLIRLINCTLSLFWKWALFCLHFLVFHCSDEIFTLYLKIYYLFCLKNTCYVVILVIIILHSCHNRILIIFLHCE